MSGVRDGRVGCPHNAHGVCQTCAATMVRQSGYANVSPDWSNLPARQPDPKDQRIAELEVKMTHLHDACARLKDVFASLSAERDSMERRARTYDAANTKLIAERDRLRERVGELEEKLGNVHFNYKQDRERLEAALGASDKHCEIVSDQNDQLRARVQKLEAREMTKEESDKFWTAVSDSVEKTKLWPKWKRAAYDLDSERLRDERIVRASMEDTPELDRLRSANDDMMRDLSAARAECEERQQKYARASALTEQHHADAQKYYESNQRLEAECQTWKTRAERMGDRAERTHEANQRLDAEAARLREALQAVLDSDMAQREEDEGEESSTLKCARQALASTTAGTLALGCVEALRYALDHSNEPGVVSEARHALDAYDHAMSPPSTHSADVSLKAENGDTSGGETPGGTKS